MKPTWGNVDEEALKLDLMLTCPMFFTYTSESYSSAEVDPPKPCEYCGAPQNSPRCCHSWDL